MRSKLKRKQLLSTILSTALLLSQLPPVSANQQPLFSSASVLTGEYDSITVTTTNQFMDALEKGYGTIFVSGLITIGREAEASGRMLPVIIPEGTTIEGKAGSSLNCRCPIQLGGDQITFRNIELQFESSDALGSVPQREIFLAGHSLTLDNVSTYLEGSAGAFGPLGGSEAELLPSVFAGGYQNTSVGSNAVLTVINSNSKTMFQDIYMGHEEGIYQDVPYTGTAEVKLDNPVTVRGGIYTDKNSSAEISISGNRKSSFNHAKATNFIGNDATTLTLTECFVSRASIDGIGTVILNQNSYLMPQTNQFQNLVLQDESCLDLSEAVNVTVTGDFTGGEYELDLDSETVLKNTTGNLVLDKEGTFIIEGKVTGTTVFQTENKNFPGIPVIGKEYIIAGKDALEENFIIPEKYTSEGYQLQYHAGTWSVFRANENGLPPSIGAVEILYAPSAIDLSNIRNDDTNINSEEDTPEPIPDESVFCNIIWKDTEGNKISFYDAIGNLFDLYYSLCIKTDYLNSSDYDSAIDWENNIYFTYSEEQPDYLYFIAGEQAKTGDYTFRFYPMEIDGMINATIEEIKNMDFLAEVTIYFYDSSKIEEDTISISENAEIQPIAEQVYTGKPICPEVEVVNHSSDEQLVKDVDYRVSYENNSNVGEATVKVVGIGKYSGEMIQKFSIIKSESEVVVTAAMSSDSGTDTTSVLAAYGDKIRFVCQAVPVRTMARTAQPNTVDFYCGEVLLGTAPVDSKGQAVLVYNTAEQKIPIGTSDVYADFGGTASLNPAQSDASVSITLTKQILAEEEIKNITLKDFTYDKTRKTAELVSFTWEKGQEGSASSQEEKVVFVSGEAKLASAKAGTYSKAEILSWSLNEKDAEWYQLPEISKPLLVDPEVTIIPAKAPEQVTIYSSAAPGQTQNVLIQDKIPAKLLDENITYQLEKTQFGSSILGVPSITDGVLTYQAGEIGSETIPVIVTSENYQPMTVLVTVFITEKSNVKIDLQASDMIYNGKPYDKWETVLQDESSIIVTYYDLIEEQSLTEAPIDAGSYSITVHIENDTEIGEETAHFRINPKEIHIRPIDRTIQVGEEIPDFSNPQLGIDYEFESGYEPVNGEDLGTIKMLYAQSPNSEKEGSYEILIGLLEKEHKNYTITEAKGTLSVQAQETKPEETEPETTDPETTTEEDNKPEETEPETTNPEMTTEEDSKPEETEPETTDPETTTEEDNKPEETEPETTDPETTIEEDNKPEETEPETTDSETTTEEENKPEETEPETTDPETTIEEDNKPEETEPETTDSETTTEEENKPEETEPETTDPETTIEEDNKPEETEPETTDPETTTEEENKPETTEPETTTEEEDSDDSDFDDDDSDDDSDVDDRPVNNNKNPVTENSVLQTFEKIPSAVSGVDYKDPVKGYISFTQGIVTGSGNGYAKWKQNNDSWWLEYADGTWAHGQRTSDGQQIYKWEKINGAWYSFNSDGYVENGWNMDFGYQGWFYIDINSGMKTGWQLIGGKWYYFNPISDGTKGKMFADCYTPDGWYVDKSGAWDEGIQYKK